MKEFAADSLDVTKTVNNDVIHHIGNNKFSDFKDVTKAPKAIQTAAEAVVRVRWRKTSGTGFFANYLNETWFITNNHVLGFDSCSKEGCYITVDINFQKDKKYKSVELLAVPQSANSDLDVSFYKVYKENDKGEFTDEWSTSHILNFKITTVESLVNTNAHIVGHPHGSIKKWDSSIIKQNINGFIVTTAASYLGNSGSPLLNNSGEVVGILHSGNFGFGSLTNDDFLLEIYNSPSALILPVLEASIKNDKKGEYFASIDLESINFEMFLLMSDFFLNNHEIIPVLTDDQNLTEQLILRCEEALDNWTSGDQSSFLQQIESCDIASDWFKCDQPHLLCLQNDEDNYIRWVNSVESIQLELDKSPGPLAPALIYDTCDIKSKQYSSDKQFIKDSLHYKCLTDYFSSTGQRISFFDAGILILLSDSLPIIYQDINLIDYITNYHLQPSYWYDLESLIKIIPEVLQHKYNLLKKKDNTIKEPQEKFKKQLKKLYQQILKEQKLSLKALLTLEEKAYMWEVLD
jgi:V8-like Glu-specific endopeptidase